MVGVLRHCKDTLTRDLNLQFFSYLFKPKIEYGLLVYGLISECQLRLILMLQKKILRIIYNLPSHASFTHLFQETSIKAIFAMYVGVLLKCLLFNIRNFVKKCISSSHNMKTRRQEKALFNYAKTSKLTEDSIQYKAVKLYNMLKEIGLWPVGIDRVQNTRLHRFCRDILNLYLNDNNDILAFFK